MLHREISLWGIWISWVGPWSRDPCPENTSSSSHLHLSESRLPVFKQFCLLGPAGSVLGVLCCLPEKDGASHPHLAKSPQAALCLFLSPNFLGSGFSLVLFLLQECASFWQTCMDFVRSIWDAGFKVPQPGSLILHQSPGPVSDKISI